MSKQDMIDYIVERLGDMSISNIRFLYRLVLNLK